MSCPIARLCVVHCLQLIVASIVMITIFQLGLRTLEFQIFLVLILTYLRLTP